MRNYYALILFAAIFSVQAVDVPAMEAQRAVTIPTPEYPKATKHIAQTNLSKTATNMYTVQQSGRYYVDTNLAAAPDGTDRNVIRIPASVSNVVLDLNGMTIHQVSGNTQAGLNAIDIEAGASNVTIMNGFINNVTDVGINVGTGCNNIRLINVGINNCDGGGVQATTSNNLYLENVDCTNCVGGGTSAPNNGDAVGLYMTTCTGFELKNCNFSNNQEAATTKDAYGAHLVTCKDGKVTNCQFNDNSSNNGTYGANITTGSSSIIFDSCQFSNNSGSSSSLTSYGARIHSGNGITFDNCQFNNNSNTANDTVGAALFSSNAIIFRDCKALYNNTGASAGTDAIGFFMSVGSSCIYENCDANNQTSNTSDAFGSAFGFYIAGSNNILKNCNANGNNCSSSGGHGYGFYVINSSGSIVDGCTACGNKTQNSAATSFSYGIYITGSNYNAVTNNKMINNVGSSANNYGFFDPASGTKTFLGGNVSHGHGAVTPSTTVNLTNSTGGGNYYFELAGTINTDNSPGRMITEKQIGGVQNIGTFGTFDNLSLYQ